MIRLWQYRAVRMTLLTVGLIVGLAVATTQLSRLMKSLFNDEARGETYGGFVAVTLISFGSYAIARMIISIIDPKPLPRWFDYLPVVIFVGLNLCVISVALHYYDEYRSAAWMLARTHMHEAIMLNPADLFPDKKDRELFYEQFGRTSLERRTHADP